MAKVNGMEEQNYAIRDTPRIRGTRPAFAELDPVVANF